MRLINKIPPPLWVFGITWLFLIVTVNPQKLVFYSLQNAIVESLVDFGTWGILGRPYKGSNWFFENLRTQTPEMRFVGDAYEYQNMWYPAKSYGPHYVAGVLYAVVKYGFHQTFANNFQLVTTILVSFTSLLLVSIAAALIYKLALRVSGHWSKALMAVLLLVFGSLMSGAINIRSEETFGYWLYLCVFLTTFWPSRKYVITIIQSLALVYCAYSLPLATLLLPLGLYRVYRASNRRWDLIGLTVILSVLFLTWHNHLIFDRWVFSNYSIGVEKIPGYRLGLLQLSWSNFIEKFNFYFLNPQTSILRNYPLIVLGAWGLFISHESRLTKIITYLTCLGFIGYVTNIGETTGWVGFGSGRYMMGIFPILYIYIPVFMRKLNVLTSLILLIVGSISLYHGLFYYLSPVRNVYDSNPDVLNFLPFGAYTLWIVAIVGLELLFIPMLWQQTPKLNKTKSHE